jgi:cytochrome c553
LPTAARPLRINRHRTRRWNARHAADSPSDAQPGRAIFRILVPFTQKSPVMKLTIKSILFGLPFVVAAVLVAAPVAENWENHCAKCHGADGKGQTKAGKKLNVKDYTDAKVQAEMKDEEMLKATTNGILDKGGKEKMKAYKDELNAEELKELVAYVRSFSPKAKN